MCQRLTLPVALPLILLALKPQLPPMVLDSLPEKRYACELSAAMGTALFDPDCNAYRELTAWFEEDVSVAVPHSRDRGRKDYNFRNACSNSMLATKQTSR